MVLRPATPLAVVLFVAFAFHLLATISAPLVKAIPLAENAGTTFGVFGTCKGNSCSSIGVGYGASQDTPNAFSFKNASTRHSLSSILILHPVAALLTLICFACAIAAHFHSPAHSSKFLLGLVFFMVPTFLVSLLAFVIDLVLFLPHAAWGAWITLAATVLIFVCGILTCAMRRTMRSRKEQRKRIAENAEMSGENFYNRQQTSVPPPSSQQATTPMVNGAPGSDSLPGFAVYDKPSRTSNDDDRTPLNASNASRTATGVSGGSSQPAGSEDGMERYGGRGGSSMRGRGGRPGYNGPRDEYGNPLPPAGYGPEPVAMPGDYMRRPSQDSQRSVRSRGSSRGGYAPRGAPRGGPYRGRGGPPRGRGGPMRGGPMGPPRGGGQMGGRGAPMGMAYGGPEPGYGQAYGDPDYGQPQQPQGQEYGQAYGGPSPYAPGPYARQPSPGPPSAPGYGRQPSPGPPSNPGMRNVSPGPPSAPGGYAVPYGSAYAQSRPDSLARAESPPPLPSDMPGDMPPSHPDPNMIGQAVEMDHLTGSPANTPHFIPPPHPFRDSDSDVQGLVGMQQARNDPISPTSLYSTQRTDAFTNSSGPQSRFPSTSRHGTPPLQAIAGSPAMVAARQSPQIAQAPSHMQPSRARVSGDNYYEDVDPRFDQEHMARTIPQTQTPASLMPGPQRALEPSASYDSVEQGPSSDSSHFTSISERGVNPAWRGDQGPGPYGPGGVPHRGPPPPHQQRDFMLSTNPDFEIAPGRGTARTGPGMF